MKTTAVILNYNGEKYLKDLILALDKEECLILIIDNHSTDKSIVVADEVKKQLSEPYKLRWIELNRNYGFSIGNNIGAKNTNTENILFLNNDTLPMRGFLKKMENANYPIVGAKLIFGEDRKEEVPTEKGTFIFQAEKGTVQHAGVYYYEKQGVPYEHGRGLNPNDERVTQSREVKSVTAACMLVKRDVFFKVGAFSEEFINGWEDTDFCLRALEKGYRCWYEADAEVIHYTSTAQGRFLKEIDNKNKWIAKWHKDRRIFRIL